MDKATYMSNEKHDYDINACKLLAIAILFAAINDSFRLLSRFSGVPTQILSIIPYMIWGYYLLVFLNKEFANIYKRLFGVLFLTGLFFLASYLLFPDTRRFFGTNFMKLRQIFIVYLPAAIITSKIKDFTSFFDFMRRYSLVGIFILHLSLAFKDATRGYYMVFSYNLLPLSFMMFYTWAIKKDKAALLIFLLTLFTSILFGGRMSLFSLMLYPCLYGLRAVYNKLTSRQRVRFFSVVLSAGALIFFAKRSLMMLAGQVLGLLGASSRTVKMLSTGSITDLGFRSSIYKVALDVIKKDPFKMHGIFGDRPFLYERWADVPYVHNIFLEMIIAFGIILASIIVLFLLIKGIMGYLRATPVNKEVYILWCCVYLPRAMVSGSFVIEGGFYLLLGILFSSNVKLLDKKLLYRLKGASNE